jgi:hypothetical protein
MIRHPHLFPHVDDKPNLAAQLHKAITLSSISTPTICI